MMEMKRYKLSEIATVEISGVDKKRKQNETPVKLCNFTDVYHNWAITKDLEDSFMDATASEKEIKTFSLKKGQVAFTKDSETRDDIGIPTYIADNFENVLLGYHTALITPDKTKLNGKYLNAFMNSKYIQKYFENNASGSGQRYTLSNDTLNSIPIIIPNLTKQKVVGNFFSNIDKKIALNKKINAKLEAMAKRLYDYWFVQFDFPNEEGKPYKSSGGKMEYNATLKRDIPEGWEAVQIQSILDKHPSTKRYNTSEYLHEGKYPIVDQDSSTFIAGYTNEDDELLRRFPAVLFGDHSMCVKFLNFEFCRGADGTQILYSNDDRIKPYYLYLVVKSLTIPNQGYSRHFKYLKELPVILPSLELAAKFQEIVKPIYEKKTKCDKQIEKLSRLRDRLLPLLMNGQVEVEG